MKTTLKQLALILGLCFVFVGGCSTSATIEATKNYGIDIPIPIFSAKGRFVESVANTDITMNSSYCVNPEGQLEIFEMQTYEEQLYESENPLISYKVQQEDGSFLHQELPWDEQEANILTILNMCFDNQGRRYILYFGDSDEDSPLKYHLGYIEKGSRTIHEIEVEWMAADPYGKIVRPYSFPSYADYPEIVLQEDLIAAVEVNSEKYKEPYDEETEGQIRKDLSVEAADAESETGEGEFLQEEIPESVSFSTDVIDYCVSAPGDMKIAGNGDILVADNFRAVMQYSPNGLFKTAYFCGENDFGIIENTLMVVNENRSQIYLYDLEKGNLEYEVVPDLGIDMSGGISITNDAKYFYVATAKGIFRYAPKGTLWEKIMEGELTSLSMPSLVINSFFSDNAGGFYCNTWDLIEQERSGESVSRLFNYSFDPEIPVRPSEELTIYMDSKSSIFDQTASVFRQKYPDVHVNIEIHEGESDYWEKLLDDLEAEKKPDIIVFDQISSDVFAYEGFLNIYDWVSENIQNEEWFEGIARAYEQEGEIYFLPTGFIFQVIAADPAIQNFADLVQWVEEHPGEPLLYDTELESLLRNFFPSQSPAIIDIQSGKIDRAELVLFLEGIKKVYESIPKDPNAEREREQLAQNAMEYGIPNELMVVDDSLPYAFGDVQASIQWIYRTSEYAMAQNMNQQIKFPYRAFPEQENMLFLPKQIVSINDESEKQDIALEFLGILLSEQMQSAYVGDYLPVNADFSYQAGQGLALTSSAETFYDSYGRSLTIANSFRMDAEEYESFVDFCRNFRVIAYNDQCLLEEMLVYCKAYINGDITAQKAAETIAVFYEE